MAYDLEEQEQIASLKAWWDRYGNALTSLVLGVAVAVAGYNVWQWYQRDRTAKAAGAYEELQRAVAAKDQGHVRELTGVLLDKFGSTAYAEMGALLAAKANIDSGDAKTAKAQLQWTIEHAIDPEYRAIGRVRMAGVLLDEGDYDAALKQVDAKTAGELSVPFQASFADRRGDIYLAQNKTRRREARVHRGARAARGASRRPRLRERRPAEARRPDGRRGRRRADGGTDGRTCPGVRRRTCNRASGSEAVKRLRLGRARWLAFVGAPRARRLRLRGSRTSTSSRRSRSTSRRSSNRSRRPFRSSRCGTRASARPVGTSSRRR